MNDSDKKSSTHNTNESDISEEIVYDDDRGAEAIKKLRKRLKECEKEKRENLDGWQRAQADMMNLRKQHAEELTNARARAESDVLESLLPVLDSFDAALSGDAWQRVDEVWRSGIEHIHAQLLDTLATQGIAAYGSVNEIFDPNLHEALGHEEGGESNTIARIERRGYKNARGVIRPAQVIVYT